MMAFLMGLKTVSPAELNRLRQATAVTIVDVNSRQSWNQAHVPGARHLDPNFVDASTLPADKAAALIFYCSNPMCRKAPTAARHAKALGYADVRVMSAGISGWQSQGLPTEKSTP